MKLDFGWSKGGFDNVMIMDLKFTNGSDYSVKDLTVSCTHYAPSGTRIDSNTGTVYEIVPAHGKKSVKDFNMGFIASQASKTGCEITKFIVVR